MIRLGILLSTLAAGSSSAAQEPYAPRVQPASSEAAEAMARFELAEGFSLELFAAEPMLANPVCFYADHDGNTFVAETFRHYAGVIDMRDHMDWLDEDLAARTVADRVAMIERHEGDAVEARYGREHERVRRLRDSDGDGRADEATVFADGFDDTADGIGAGLLSYKGDVYYTCIPKLWRLRDADGDGRADQRDVLSEGYGVHVALLGHDLHGLRIGPDKRLYFSCGDRAFNVETAEGGVIEHTRCGAVLRCELDGSGLEVFHTGLRNPQELVFDAYGNLFTGDNNSDGGDKARWVYVIEGGDSGWRYAYQWITSPNLRGPWNDEKQWLPPFEGQAAFLVPPIANLADGPSGLTYAPGTGFGDAWREHFFLADFRGTPTLSGVHAFTVEPRGAGFSLGPVQRLVWGTLVTDVDFAPDGSLLFSDWVDGWNKTGKGRLYRLRSEDESAREEGRRTAELLARGMDTLEPTELERLLGHDDQRVRQEAQFELTERGPPGIEMLERTAYSSADLFPRLHAIWGLGIAIRQGDANATVLRLLLHDDDAEIRAQLARVLGDLRDPHAVTGLVSLLRDDSARVRSMAAIALGRIGTTAVTEPLFALLAENGAQDPWLRHAGVMGLLGCASNEELLVAAERDDPHQRMAALLALRRRGHPGVAHFLADADDQVRLSAARAVIDGPIDAGLPALAEQIVRDDLAGKPMVRRVLDANFRLGGESHARAVARFALREDQAAAHRVEALDMLAEWGAPSGRERVMGEWRPIAPRPVEFMPALCRELMVEGIETAPAEVARAWIDWAVTLRLTDARAELASWAEEPHHAPSLRVRALEALGQLGIDTHGATLRAALADGDGSVRAAALELLPRASPSEALPILSRILGVGETSERRAAYRALGSMTGPEVERLLAEQLELARAGLIPVELALDLVLACRAQNSQRLNEQLAERESPRAADPALAPFLDSLFGGQAARGQAIFERNAALSCLRCHPSGGDAATGVGQDLRGIGERLTRLQLLEAIVDPNRRIAPGFESELVVLDDESVHVGRVLDEDDRHMNLINAEGETLALDKARVTSRRPTKSAMPEGLSALLTPELMRDLIEYLARR